LRGGVYYDRNLAIVIENNLFSLSINVIQYRTIQTTLGVS
jgi:hypothetical protein